MLAIELENKRHVFRTTTGTFRRHTKEEVALDGISPEIDEGEMFGAKLRSRLPEAPTPRQHWALQKTLWRSRGLEWTGSSRFCW